MNRRQRKLNTKEMKELINLPDWDFTSLYKLMAFKLRRMALYHKEHGHLVGHIGKYRQMMHASALCEQIANDKRTYSEEQIHRILDSKPDGGVSALEGYVWNIRQTEAERAVYTKFYTGMVNEQKERMEYLHDMLKRRSTSWWD